MYLHHKYTLFIQLIIFINARLLSMNNCYMLDYFLLWRLSTNSYQQLNQNYQACYFQKAPTQIKKSKTNAAKTNVGVNLYGNTNAVVSKKSRVLIGHIYDITKSRDRSFWFIKKEQGGETHMFFYLRRVGTFDWRGLQIERRGDTTEDINI